MTFHLRHAWNNGATVNGAALATCEHCAVLRVTLGSDVYFIRRISDESRSEDPVRAEGPLAVTWKPRDDPSARVTAVEPQCLEPDGHFRAPW